tara:strand:+ start:832 stop:1224 length:393 start_codon:yes stop_codon:yes gene_type:complete
MTFDFECDSKDMDQVTADHLETARVLLEEQLSWTDWPDELIEQSSAFCTMRLKVSNCLQIMTGISGASASVLIQKLLDDNNIEYVPWLVWKVSYLPKESKEMQETILNAERLGKQKIELEKLLKEETEND